MSSRAEQPSVQPANGIDSAPASEAISPDEVGSDAREVAAAPPGGEAVFLDQAPAASRLLSRLEVAPDGWCEAFFERREVTELAGASASPGALCRREEGLAVRIVDGERTWSSSRDRLDAETLVECCREVARVVPRAVLHAEGFGPRPWWPNRSDEDSVGSPSGETLSTTGFLLSDRDDTALREFPLAVAARLRQLRVAFDYRLEMRRWRRVTQVVRRSLVAEPAWEQYFDVTVRTPRFSWGTLLTDLSIERANAVAERLAASVLSHSAPTPASSVRAAVLGSSAAAVFLHEAVSHALEADLLSLSGRPESARGVALGSELLDVLDSPATAPPGLTRRNDDEGMNAERRWLLRRGVVEQPLADRSWSMRSDLIPGASRRADRHQPPLVRSSHLELLAGDHDTASLLREGEGGVWVDELSGGTLDPLTGEVRLLAPWARSIRSGELAERLGPVLLRGRLTRLLGAVCAVGASRRAGGAGWCAKGGQRQPVWATAPALALAEVEVSGP